MIFKHFFLVVPYVLNLPTNEPVVILHYHFCLYFSIILEHARNLLSRYIFSTLCYYPISVQNLVSVRYFKSIIRV